MKKKKMNYGLWYYYEKLGPVRLPDGTTLEPGSTKVDGGYQPTLSVVADRQALSKVFPTRIAAKKYARMMADFAAKTYTKEGPYEYDRHAALKRARLEELADV